jgi:serine/threonine protein kinase
MKRFDRALRRDPQVSENSTLPPTKKASVLKRLSFSLVPTYIQCKGPVAILDSAHSRPRQCLTSPATPGANDGYDNASHDFLLYVNDVISSPQGVEYRILALLGKGTFGQVVRCETLGSGERVALKVIKNKPEYTRQAHAEIDILSRLPPNDHIIQLKEWFFFRSHLCIVLEECGVDLFALIKLNNYCGLSLNTVRVFARQLLDALSLLYEHGVIHADLKPENILLADDVSVRVKIIDFGSACFVGQSFYAYIQSRFYRAPEVIVGAPYDSSIDMWSLGCILLELFLGIPIFPGASQYDQLFRVVTMCGALPDELLVAAAQRNKYFKLAVKERQQVGYIFKTRVEYISENPEEEAIEHKRYFKYDSIEELVMHYASDSSEEERLVFLNLVMGCLKVDPRERWSPLQALMHPFVTGQPMRPEEVRAWVPEPSLAKVPIPYPYATNGPNIPMDVNNSGVMSSTAGRRIGSNRNSRGGSRNSGHYPYYVVSGDLAASPQLMQHPAMMYGSPLTAMGMGGGYMGLPQTPSHVSQAAVAASFGGGPPSAGRERSNTWHGPPVPAPAPVPMPVPGQVTYGYPMGYDPYDSYGYGGYATAYGSHVPGYAPPPSYPYGYPHAPSMPLPSMYPDPSATGLLPQGSASQPPQYPQEHEARRALLFEQTTNPQSLSFLPPHAQGMHGTDTLPQTPGYGQMTTTSHAPSAFDTTYV